ncbi:hypothetical protein [Sedimenticola hydrogenitrophicus]|uniref:hypothetical protein n=1 Tax=Sedimenticola hydrogenitrophicus TaxID=2967975 RepID=UPI0023B1293A|nr:hypothetical protein [Sedimenticola hydrogenitrophicus]
MEILLYLVFMAVVMNLVIRFFIRFLFGGLFCDSSDIEELEDRQQELQEELDEVRSRLDSEGK